MSSIKKIEHIGIAVKNLAEAARTYEQVLGTPAYKMEAVESEGVNTLFFKVGETKIELLEGTCPESPITKFIEKKGSGIHHMAFEVDDIDAEIARLQQQGYQLINAQPKQGADRKLIAFLHPKSTEGVLVELCMEQKD